VQKSVAIICGFDAMSFNTELLCGICSSLKLTGYRSKPKVALLRIIGVENLHQSFHQGAEEANNNNNNTLEAKVPAKAKIFHFDSSTFCSLMKCQLSLSTLVEEKINDFRRWLSSR
jgi:hypothetical protein